MLWYAVAHTWNLDLVRHWTKLPTAPVVTTWTFMVHLSPTPSAGRRRHAAARGQDRHSFGKDPHFKRQNTMNMLNARRHKAFKDMSKTSENCFVTRSCLWNHDSKHTTHWWQRASPKLIDQHVSTCLLILPSDRRDRSDLCLGQRANGPTAPAALRICNKDAKRMTPCKSSSDFNPDKAGSIFSRLDNVRLEFTCNIFQFLSIF